MPYQFKPSCSVSSFFFILIFGLVSLGLWQLNRADQQQVFQVTVDQRGNVEPLSLNMPFEEFSPYQAVRATGQYRENESILLDNINYQNQPGFYLITPFEITASRAVILVNRGWLPQSDTIEELPNFKTPQELITLTGHLSYSPPKPSSVESFSNPITFTPPLWHYLDADIFSQMNGYPVLPLILNLNKNGQTSTLHLSGTPLNNTEARLIQDWSNYDPKPDFLISFSDLWFALSLVGLAIYLSISFKKIKRN